jgi:flagellar biogenesis protein FliO
MSALPSSAPMPSTAVASQPIPFRAEADLQGGGVGFPAAALACLVVLAAAVAILRRWGPAGGSPLRRPRSMQVLESTRLADRTRVSVLRYRDREIVIAHSEHAIAILSDEAVLPAPRDET